MTPRELRESHHLSQREFAVSLGISLKRVQQIESGGIPGRQLQIRLQAAESGQFVLRRPSINRKIRRKPRVISTKRRIRGFIPHSLRDPTDSHWVGEVRSRLKLNRQELADKIGVSASLIGRIENQSIKMSDRVRSLIEALASKNLRA